MQVQRISRHGNSSGIVIPLGYLRELGWHQGDYVVLERYGDELIVYRVRVPSDPTPPTRAARRRADARAAV